MGFVVAFALTVVLSVVTIWTDNGVLAMCTMMGALVSMSVLVLIVCEFAERRG